MVSGLSSRCVRVPPGFRPAFPGAASDHPAHPPTPLYSPRTSTWDPVLCAILGLESVKMRSREAKDFLVQHTLDQARLEGVPLSDLEKRMMYFTEGKDAVEDPITLNDEFDGQCDSGEFEHKVSRLMRHAYARLKKEEPGNTLKWKEAIRTLRNGDHYILVLAGQHLAHGSARYWRLIAVFFVPLALLYVFAFFLRSPGLWGSSDLPPYGHFLPTLGPRALRVAQALFLVLFLAAIFIPKVFEPATNWTMRLVDWAVGRKDE